MEKSKKRHNPPIFEEDPAVNAFDRNNDSAKPSLDSVVQITETPVIEIVKSEDTKIKEFYNLIAKFFGKQSYSFRKAYFEDFDAVMNFRGEKGKEKYFFDEFKYLVSEKSNALKFFENKREKWYKKNEIQEYITLEVDVPEEADFWQELDLKTFFTKGKFSPIKITAHTPKALAQAKIFALEYQELTGQKAKIIQDCVVEDLEEKVEEKPNFALEGVKRMGRKTFSIKNPVANFFKGFALSYFAMPSIERLYPAFCDEKKRAEFPIPSGIEPGAATGLIISLLGMGAIYAGTILGLATDHSYKELIEQGYWVIPALHLGPNVLSGCYEWWRCEKKEAEEEYKQKKQN